MNLQHFNFFTRTDVLARTTLRKFETKFGEVVQTLQPGFTVQKELEQSTAGYVIFGIPEDIGVQANGPTTGTSAAWKAFLSVFLNSQSNDFLEGEEVLLLGYFDFSAIQELVHKMAPNAAERTEARLACD